MLTDDCIDHHFKHKLWEREPLPYDRKVNGSYSSIFKIPLKAPKPSILVNTGTNHIRIDLVPIATVESLSPVNYSKKYTQIRDKSNSSAYNLIPNRYLSLL